MKKRITSLILMFSFVLSMTVFAADSNESFSKEIEFLSSYGIMSTLSDEAMAEKITQEQFRSALSMILDGDEQKMAEIDSFGEVYQSGGEVTLMKAVITLVKLIGYDNLAIQNGGTNNGYIEMARTSGILDGVRAVKEDEAITYAQAGKMIYNTLQIPLVTISFENGRVVYKIDEEKTLLNDNMSLYNVKGVVTATADYALPGYTKTQPGIIMIGDEEFEISQAGMKELFGGYVTAEYRYDEKEETSKILKMNLRYNNSVLTLQANDIEEFDEEGKYTYIDPQTEKDKTVSIAQNATYYYNYDLIETAEQLDKVNFVPQTGYVKLLDSDRDGKYDVVIILDYEVRLVELAESENIYSQYGESAIEVTYDTIITDASNATFNDASVLSKNDVVHVIFKEGTNEARYIYVASQSVSGKITYITRESEPMLVIDKDKEYKIPQSKIGLTAILKANMSVTVYLDMNNNFAGYTIAPTASWTYAYMIDIKIYDSEETGEPVLAVKTYDLNEGKILNLTCKEKVKADDVSYKRNEYQALIDKHDLHEHMEDGSIRVWDQLIRYKRNTDGLITEIDFAPNATDFSPFFSKILPSNATGLYKLTGSMSNRLSNDPGTIASAADATRSRLPYWANAHPIYHKRLIYTDATRSYNTWFTEMNVAGDTVALFVPKDRNNVEGYRISTAGVYRSEAQWVIDFYTIAEESEATTIMVFYEGDGAPAESSGGGVNNDINIIDSLSTAFIITDINEVYLEDIELATHEVKLCGINGEITLYTKNSDWVSTVGLNEGDFVAMAYSGQYIDAIEILTSVEQFKHYDSPDFMKMTGGIFADRGQLIGYAYDNRDGMGLVTTDPANINNISWTDLSIMAIQSAAPLYEYDAKTGTVTASNMNCIKWYQNTHDIEKTSIVYTGYRNADAKYTFVINNLFE